jgi:ABC-type glycerol-3-phosphate transport system substrate-binding protein
MMRILGKEGMQAAYEGKKGGFASPEVIKAFQLYKDLAALKPFQKGYLANTYPEAAGTFHDGKTAFHLMGTWDIIHGGPVRRGRPEGATGRKTRVVFVS